MEEKDETTTDDLPEVKTEEAQLLEEIMRLMDEIEVDPLDNCVC